MGPPVVDRAEMTGSSQAVESVALHIDKMIGRGIFKPGDAVSETALIAALGVGRVPVREAIRILAGEGVLELVQNRSARVRLVDAEEILEMLDVLTGLSITAIHAMTTKPLGPGLADKLTTLAARIAKLGKAGANSQELMQEISRFHYILIASSGNGYLLRLLRKTRINYYSRYLVALLGQRAFLDAAPRYTRLTQAIIRQDGPAAMRILLLSVERSKSHAKIDGDRTPRPLASA